MVLMIKVCTKLLWKIEVLMIERNKLRKENEKLKEELNGRKSVVK